MSDKKDLISLFGVEGMIERKSFIDDTLETLRLKTPYVITQEIKDLIDMMSAEVESGNGDIDLMGRIADAGLLRSLLIKEIVVALKITIEDMEKKAKDD